MSTFKFEAEAEITKPWFELQNRLHNSGVMQSGIDIGHCDVEYRKKFKAPYDIERTIAYRGDICVGSDIFKMHQIGFRIGGMTEDAVNHCKKKAIERCRDIVLEAVASARDNDVSGVIPIVGLVWREVPRFDYYDDKGNPGYLGIPEYVDCPIRMGYLYFRFGVTSLKQAAAIVRESDDAREARSAKSSINPLGADPGASSNSNKSTEQG